MPQTMIETALATVAQHEADQTALGSAAPAPSMPLALSLILAVYMHERRGRRRGAQGDARPEQLIRAARDAQIPEDEIQCALALADRHALDGTQLQPSPYTREA
jgi:hypothetical protein